MFFLKGHLPKTNVKVFFIANILIKQTNLECELLRTQLDKLRKENVCFSKDRLPKLSFKVFLTANFLNKQDG